MKKFVENMKNYKVVIYVFGLGKIPTSPSIWKYLENSKKYVKILAEICEKYAENMKYEEISGKITKYEAIIILGLCSGTKENSEKYMEYLFEEIMWRNRRKIRGK